MTIEAITAIRAAIKTYNDVDRGWRRRKNGNHPAIKALEEWMGTHFPNDSTGVLTPQQKEEITRIFTQTQQVTYAYFSQAAYNAWLKILPTLFDRVTPLNAAEKHANICAAVAKKAQGTSLDEAEINAAIAQPPSVKSKKMGIITGLGSQQSTTTLTDAYQSGSLTNSLSSILSGLPSTPVSNPRVITLSEVISEYAWNDTLTTMIDILCSDQSPKTLPFEVSSLTELQTIQATVNDPNKFTHVLTALGNDRLKSIIQNHLACHEALLVNATDVSGLCQQLVNADLAQADALRVILIAHIHANQAPLLIESIMAWYDPTIPVPIYTALAKNFNPTIFAEFDATFKAGMASAYLANDDLISANQLAPETVVTHITTCDQNQLAAWLATITADDVTTLDYSVRRALSLKAFDYLNDTTIKTQLAILLSIEPTVTIDNVTLFTKAKRSDLDLTVAECDALASNVFFAERLKLTFGAPTKHYDDTATISDIRIQIKAEQLTYAFPLSSGAIAGTIEPYSLDDTHYQALRTAAEHQSPRELSTASKIAFFVLTDIKHPQTATLRPVDIERLAAALPAESSLKEPLFMPTVFLTQITLTNFSAKRTEKNNLVTKPKKDLFHKIHRNISDLTSISSNDIARITSDFRTAIAQFTATDYQLKAMENFLRTIPQDDFITLLSTMTKVDATLVTKSGIKPQDFIDAIAQHLNPSATSKSMFGF